MPEHPHSHPHEHAHVTGDNERRLLWTLALTAGYMVVQVIGGVISGSLALLADAGHMLSDVGALALAWAGVRLDRLLSEVRGR